MTLPATLLRSAPGRGHPRQPRRVRAHSPAGLPADRRGLEQGPDRPARSAIPAPAASPGGDRASAAARPDWIWQDRSRAAVGRNPGRGPETASARDTARVLHPAVPRLDQRHDRPPAPRTRPGRDLVGVAHARAASYYLHAAADDDCATLDASAARRALARNRATRLFREPVRVGTPYQPLVRGALAGPAHSSILIDAANSVFILDELHIYETGKLGIILAMIRLWTRLGGRIGVVSATFPPS